MSDIDLQLLRNLVDASPQAVALVDVQDPDQPVIYVNASFQTLTGYLPGHSGFSPFRMSASRHKVVVMDATGSWGDARP